MFWEDEDDKTLPFKSPDTVFDVMFSIQCKALPIDHAWVLSQQIQQYFPWITTETGAGIHQIHVAESNNGWIKPDEENALLFPSKRTKLILRIPSHKFDEIKALSGETLDIEGHEILIGNYKKRSLGNAGVIFAKHMQIDPHLTEDDFLTQIAEEIKIRTNTTIKKMLCGRRHKIKTSDGILDTIHLMIADLDDETSITIQQEGLGLGRELGCGLFLPHKSIKTLKPTE